MKKKEIFYTITIILTLVVMSFGSTYAYFALATRTEPMQLAQSANYSLNLEINPIFPEPEKGPYAIIPMKDELALKAYKGYNNNPCIDKNGAAVCYIYKIHIFDYNKELEYLSGTINVKTNNISNLSYRLFNNKSEELEVGMDEENNLIYYNKIITEEDMSLGTKINIKNTNSIDLYLMIWLSDTGIRQNETDIGSFAGSVTIYAGAGGQISGYISSAIEGNYIG